LKGKTSYMQVPQAHSGLRTLYDFLINPTREIFKMFMVDLIMFSSDHN